MRYAYRDEPSLLSRVAAIADGNGHDDMIQDLNDCAVLGRENPEPLQAIGFDLDVLKQAAVTSDEMADLLAASTTDRAADREVKVIRDRAYTYLKQAVDEVRACGQYVFWRNEERLLGYASEYFRARAARKSAAPAAEPAAEVVDQPAQPSE